MPTSPKRRLLPRLRTASLKSGEGVKVEHAVTIDRPVGEVFLYWRNLENLPLFMTDLYMVTQTTPTVSHWVVRTDNGLTLQWDAQIIEERENEMISWRSLPDADLDNAGSVWFTPAAGGRGTVVKLSMKYSPPGGKIAVGLAKIFKDDPKKHVVEDLFRFKSLLEAGEIPTTRGQPSGDPSAKR